MRVSNGDGGGVRCGLAWWVNVHIKPKVDGTVTQFAGRGSHELRRKEPGETPTRGCPIPQPIQSHASSLNPKVGQNGCKASDRKGDGRKEDQDGK